MQPTLHLSQQQTACIRADLAAIKSADHSATPQVLKFHLFSCTLCFHKAALLLARNCLVTQPLCHDERPYSSLSVRNSGWVRVPLEAFRSPEGVLIRSPGYTYGMLRQTASTLEKCFGIHLAANDSFRK